MLSFWQGTDDECQAVAGSKANDPFPLTPALSPEERENRPLFFLAQQRLVLADARKKGP